MVVFLCWCFSSQSLSLSYHKLLTVHESEREGKTFLSFINNSNLLIRGLDFLIKQIQFTLHWQINSAHLSTTNWLSKLRPACYWLTFCCVSHNEYVTVESSSSFYSDIKMIIAESKTDSALKSWSQSAVSSVGLIIQRVSIRFSLSMGQNWIILMCFYSFLSPWRVGGGAGIH